MGSLLVRRVLQSLLVLLASSVVVFLLVALAGDPLVELRERQPPVPEAVLAAESARLGLDRSLVERYGAWLVGFVQGDFGPSVRPNTSIAAELLPRIGVTLRLVSVSMLIALGLALVAGTVAALRRSRWPDHVLSTGAFVLIALPSFWLAILLKQIGIAVNKAAGHRVLFTVGDVSIPPPKETLALIADMAGHLVLPTIALALLHFAAWSRYHRAAIVEALASDHVRYAVLRGLRWRRVLLTHVVRPSLIPIVTVVALDLPGLVSGAIITETVFQWRGMGTFLIDAIGSRDANAVLAWLMIAAAAVVLFNLIADLLYAVIDPRVRHAGA